MCSAMSAGILSGTPRGEMVGTARFTDATHGLVCDVAFGKADGAAASDRLLHRSDTCTATLCQLDRSNLAAAQANGAVSAEVSQVRTWIVCCELQVVESVRRCSVIARVLS